ncbi:hypothetical protein CS0771_64860 [Catellatospora sp. IY07-71]|nr:hypothetical protein CS0771_64860 [Catellatospora sp. IY07-71]
MARPRIRIVLLFIVSDVFVLLGLSYLKNGHVIAERDWLGVALACALTLVGLLGIWRALRQGVVIDQDGLLVRSFSRPDRTLTWDHVSSIDCGQVFLRGGRPLYAPILQIDGVGRLPVSELGSHSLEEAEQRAADLRSLQAARTPATADRPVPVAPAEQGSPV